MAAWLPPQENARETTTRQALQEVAEELITLRTLACKLTERIAKLEEQLNQFSGQTFAVASSVVPLTVTAEAQTPASSMPTTPRKCSSRPGQDYHPTPVKSSPEPPQIAEYKAPTFASCKTDTATAQSFVVSCPFEVMPLKASTGWESLSLIHI